MKTSKTKLNDLAIDELSAVADPANMLPGYMVLKSRGLIGNDDELRPDGATVILKALADPEHPLVPEDILSDEELAWAQSVQKARPFIQAFGAIRPPGTPR